MNGPTPWPKPTLGLSDDPVESDLVEDPIVSRTFRRLQRHDANKVEAAADAAERRTYQTRLTTQLQVLMC